MKARWELKAGLAVLLIGSFYWISACQAAALDVNKATADELQTIKGIGAKTAARIVAERARGEFESLAHLSERLSGIGAKTIKKLEQAGLCAGTQQKPCASSVSDAEMTTRRTQQRSVGELATPQVIQIP